MTKSEVLKNEAAVLLAGALEQAADMAEFDWSGAADQIVDKILAAAEAKRQEET